MQADFQDMYQRSGLEDFNINPAEMLELCLSAQKRLRELAAFNGMDYAEFIAVYADGDNCPWYVLSHQDSTKYPTLLEKPI
jgi:hypothetical protein